MVKIENITKISQVTPEVTLFLRKLGFTNYYIIKIFDLVGDAAIGLTEDNPYWLLEEFPRMGFSKVDDMARKLGVHPDSHSRLEAAVTYGLRSYMGEGHTFAPLNELSLKVAEFLDSSSGLVRDVLEDMAYSGTIQIANLEGSQVVYFYGYYKAECSIAGKLAALAEPACGLAPVGGNVDALIKKCQSERGIKLSVQQTEAVKNSLISGVSIITGGPGTGKTTIINSLISIMENSGLKVAVAAPTGRAAKRIMETSQCFACTVHRLLEYYYDESTGYMRFGRNAEEPLDCNAVIIDEASMLDLMITEALCHALKPGTRLILVGDADQLPSVGAGNVLADLIDSEFFYTAQLTEIYRQSGESKIVVNAHCINKGIYPDYGDDFVLIHGDKQQEILDKIAAIAAKYPLNQVQVLTPMKKGIIGSANLNERLQSVFNPQASNKAELEFGNKIFRIGDRVMQIKNDYRLEYRIGNTADGPDVINMANEDFDETRYKAFKTSDSPFKPKNSVDKKGNGEANNKLSKAILSAALNAETGRGVFNGEIGIIKAIDKEMRSITVLYDDERWVQYPYVNLDEIELAYAVTVHKSQGSEFPIVIMPMTWFPPVLATRSLLYTAITRGKKQVIIVGRADYLNSMVENNQSRSRNSGLKARLIGMYQMI